MNPGKGMVIFGCGGHARSIAAVAVSVGFTSLLFVDESAREGENILGFAVRRELGDAVPEGWSCMPGTGDNLQRQRQVQWMQSVGWPVATLISGSATVDTGAEIAPACFVGHHAHVGPLARIGTGCIINTAAIVEHECVVGNYTHVSVNAVLAGRSKLGNFVFLGTGATVIDGVSVADRITVGAGAVVVESFSEPGTYVGCPAQRISVTSGDEAP